MKEYREFRDEFVRGVKPFAEEKGIQVMVDSSDKEGDILIIVRDGIMTRANMSMIYGEMFINNSMSVEKIIESFKQPLKQIYGLESKHMTSMVINKDRNEKIITELPYKELLDLCVVPVVEVFGDDEPSFEFIKQESLGAVEIENCFKDDDEYFLVDITDTNEAGFCTENCVRYRDSNLYISDMVRVMLRFHPENVFMAFLSNKKTYHGAKVLNNCEILTNVAEVLEDDIIILPSSIHELVILRKSLALDKNNLLEMVSDVNNGIDKYGDPDEVLSYNIYLFEKETRKLSIYAYAEGEGTDE